MGWTDCGTGFAVDKRMKYNTPKNTFHALCDRLDSFKANKMTLEQLWAETNKDLKAVDHQDGSNGSLPPPILLATVPPAATLF